MSSYIGIKDEAFIRGNVPMTKAEVRAITLSKLSLSSDDVLVDVGAGTGSISIESAHYAKQVYAIERNPDGIELIKKNKKHFKLDNIEHIKGEAPEAIDGLRFNKALIGGSGGHMDKIIEALKQASTIVINTITIENTYKGLKALKAQGYETELVQVNIAKSKDIGNVTMMMGQNPIFIITGEKNED